MVTEVQSEVLRSRLLDSGIVVYGEETFASGSKANQKIDWDQIEPESEEFVIVASYLAVCLGPYKPDCVVPVPSGADKLGEKVAELLGVPPFFAHKNKTTRDIYLDSEVAQDLFHYKRKAIVDDVFTTGSRIARLTKAIGGGVVAAAVVWNRSNPKYKVLENFSKDQSFDVESLISNYLPLMREDS